MSAQVHLTYDSSRGRVSYSLTTGGVLTIQAFAAEDSDYVVSKLTMQCDAGQSRTVTYGGQKSVTFTSTGHTACSNIYVNVVFDYDPSGSYPVSLGVSVGQGRGNVAGGGIFHGSLGSIIDIIISAEPEPGWAFDHWRIYNNSGSIDRNVTTADYIVRWTVSSNPFANMFYAVAYFVELPKFTVNIEFLNKTHKHGVIDLIVKSYSSGEEVYRRSFDDNDSFVFQRRTMTEEYLLYLSLREKISPDYPNPYGLDEFDGRFSQIPQSPDSLLIAVVASGRTSATIEIDWHCGRILCNQSGLLCKTNPAGLMYCGEIKS